MGYLHQFRDYLYYAPNFKVFTENNPPIYVLSSEKLNATSLRWIGELADFNSLYTIAQEKPALMPTLYLECPLLTQLIQK